MFKRVPAYPSESWGPMASMYYTLEAMGLLDQYHQKVFDAIHKQNVNLASKAKRDEWLKANGIDPAKYAEVEKSFTVATKIARARQLTQAYKVDSVPRFFVNGKYFTSAEQAGGNDKIFPVVDQIIAHGAQGKGLISPMKVFLTGASSGIGEALARHYAGRGATLGLVARRADFAPAAKPRSPPRPRRTSATCATSPR